ncbi:hypothetical protein TOPH_05870 [Tolypocladium ophioglossoides CBS 100239]|uniref:Meiotically up-regulated protein n=1 Tax=Tolypocladium ophioglossoides (strain CBS 100239) TaxID=1163406 RepID=A0A0L0N5R6_TOLOC|nr:hypothetical protein TOPH_05870 [Tolypocladium ophioglossoides CBS 100239]
MAALVSYSSSDDEKDEEQQQQQPQLETVEASPKATSTTTKADEAQAKPAAESPKPAPPPEPELQEPPLVTGLAPQSAVPLGPSLPPMEAPHISNDEDESEVPASPYSANRATIHDLTLPSVPNLDIPPSPPGSPPPRVSKMFDQFLALKKMGTHFNRKLEQSTALRNPSVMDKLLEFAGLDGRQQYETTVSPDLWDPMAFPESAFVEKLRKSRETLAKEREADRSGGGRSSIDFVPSTTTSAGTASGAGGLARGEKRKGGWK